MSRSLPAILLLMAIAVILILSGSAGTGFVVGLIAAGIGALLLASMFAGEVGHDERRYTERESYRRPHTSGF
jgi:hypothetical protein